MKKKFFYRVLCGFFLGLSVFAPGLSGSVIAIILGVYHDLIAIASNPFKKFKRNVVFCFPLAVGALASAVLFILAFKFLFETYEKATYLLFVGLIAGNIPVIVSEIKKTAFKKRYYIGMALAFAAALALGLFAGGAGETGKIAVTSNIAFFAFAGFIAGAAAMVPGMSVSMILIIMGVYGQLIFAAGSLLEFDFAYFIQFGVFCVCAAVGVVMSAKGIKAAFERLPGLANSLVFGFIAGSLIGIFIESLRIEDNNFYWPAGVLTLAAGLAISFLFVYLGNVMKKRAA